MRRGLTRVVRSPSRPGEESAELFRAVKEADVKAAGRGRGRLVAGALSKALLQEPKPILQRKPALKEVSVPPVDVAPQIAHTVSPTSLDAASSTRLGMFEPKVKGEEEEGAWKRRNPIPHRSTIPSTKLFIKPQSRRSHDDEEEGETPVGSSWMLVCADWEENAQLSIEDYGGPVDSIAADASTPFFFLPRTADQEECPALPSDEREDSVDPSSDLAAFRRVIGEMGSEEAEAAVYRNDAMVNLSNILKHAASTLATNPALYGSEKEGILNRLKLFVGDS